MQNGRSEVELTKGSVREGGNGAIYWNSYIDYVFLSGRGSLSHSQLFFILFFFYSFRRIFTTSFYRQPFIAKVVEGEGWCGPLCDLSTTGQFLTSSLRSTSKKIAFLAGHSARGGGIVTPGS